MVDKAVGNVLGIQLKGDKLHFVVFFEEMVSVKRVPTYLGKILFYYGYPFVVTEARKDYENMKGIFTAERIHSNILDICDLSICWKDIENSVDLNEFIKSEKELGYEIFSKH